MAKWIKRLIGLVVVLLIVGGAVFALMPQPVAVDIAEIEQGILEVTIDEEGVARIRDVFRVSAPIAGRVDRLPVDVGDQVFRNTTAVAVIRPVDPPFHDVRSRRELEAAVGAARAAVEVAKAQVAGAEAAQRLARSDLERADELVQRGTISSRASEKAIADLDTAKAQTEQARANLALRESELVSAEARLIEPPQLEAGGSDTCCLTVRSPVDGTVLDLLTESEQVVDAGAGLLEIGDPRDLEVVVHLLSADAVRISEGAEALIDEWGGAPLPAKVRRIDPAAYTKVSALGIEEQRVDAVLDITGEPDDDGTALGHEFRVMVHITVARAEDVVRVPLGALFRRGSDWAVFKVVDDRAVETPVVLGHRNSQVAEVIDGLAAGDLVVLHPSDRVVDGVAVALREEA